MAALQMGVALLRGLVHKFVCVAEAGGIHWGLQDGAGQQRLPWPAYLLAPEMCLNNGLVGGMSVRPRGPQAGCQGRIMHLALLRSFKKNSIHSGCVWGEVSRCHTPGRQHICVRSPMANSTVEKGVKLTSCDKRKQLLSLTNHVI
jgi:hypothetical protein